MNKKSFLKYILKNNLPSYIHKVFTEINPRNNYYSNWHIDLICEYLNEVENGNIKRLVINIPPRSLKSISISVAWTSWLLGHNPEKRIINASYSQNISNKLSQDTRFVMESNWYKNLFTKTRISKKQNQKSKFLTTKYGFRYSTSVGGTLTGEGGDYLIVDDPHNPTQIHSEKIRNKTVDWFLNTFSTRLNDRKNGKIIVIMQRLHNEDLCGFIENNASKDWEFLRIPIISNEKIYFNIGNKKFEMSKNQIINERLFDQKTINNLISEIGLANFETQYQQKPAKNNYKLLNKDFIKFYEKLPLKFDYIIHSWDTAIKVSETSDYSAMTCWGVYNEKYYLISYICEKYEYPDLKREIKSEILKYNPDKILIEDKASGQSIIQDLKRENIKNIEAIKAIKDKISRFASTIELFESGRVFLDKNNIKTQRIIHELTNFPDIKHDDITDTISQFLNYEKENKFKKPSPQIRRL